MARAVSAVKTDRHSVLSPLEDMARALIARANLSRAMLQLEIAVLRLELLSLHGPQADLPGNGLEE